jgi:hypothetical protein
MWENKAKAVPIKGLKKGVEIRLNIMRERHKMSK